MAVTQPFINIETSFYSKLHFAVCQLERWPFLFIISSIILRKTLTDPVTRRDVMDDALTRPSVDRDACWQLPLLLPWLQLPLALGLRRGQVPVDPTADIRTSRYFRRSVARVDGNVAVGRVCPLIVEFGVVLADVLSDVIGRTLRRRTPWKRRNRDVIVSSSSAAIVVRDREYVGRLPRQDVIYCNVIECRGGDVGRIEFCRARSVRSLDVAAYVGDAAICRFERRVRQRRAAMFRREQGT